MTTRFGLILLSAALLTQPIAAQESAGFRANPAHTGVYPAPGSVQHYGGVRWIARAPGEIRSSPAVAGSTVYFGAGNGGLYAVDTKTGAQKWRFDAGSAISSSPAVAGALVYVGAADGTLFAVDQTAGTLKWKLATGPDRVLPWGHESGDSYTSSPVLAGGLVLIGSGDGDLYAADALSGALKWRLKTEGRVRSSPAVVGEVAFVGSGDGSVYAVDLKTGKQRWRFDTEGHTLNSGSFGFDRRTVQSSPAVVNGVVYIGARDGFLYAIDASTGQQRWRFNHEVSWVNSSPAVSDGVVFAGTSDGRFVQAVDGATGKELWRYTTENIVWGSQAVVGDVVYAGDFAGYLYALDRRTGKLLWRIVSDGALASSPVLVDSTLYYGTSAGSLWATRITSGPGLKRAVFWDSTLTKAAWFIGHAALKDYLADHEYEVLNAAGLAKFLAARIADREPSVVVFALDHLPREVAAVAADSVLFRRYLNGGGKVVWPGEPPLLWPRNPANGEVTPLLELRRDATATLLGVSHQAGNFDRYTVTATDEGRRWGLPEWWRGNWGVAPGGVTTVLAKDEIGNAVAWVKSYGGRQGTGFVRIWGGRLPISEPAVVLRVAEYAP